MNLEEEMFSYVDIIKKLTEENTVQELKFITKVKDILKEKRNERNIYYKYNMEYISVYRKNSKNWFLRMEFSTITVTSAIVSKLPCDIVKMLLPSAEDVVSKQKGILRTSKVYLDMKKEHNFDLFILKAYDVVFKRKNVL